MELDITKPLIIDDPKANTITVQNFLLKFKDYYLTALDNIICLEVDCKKRKDFPTDEEIEYLKALGYINILSSTDYTRCCCGSASFIKQQDCK